MTTSPRLTTLPLSVLILASFATPTHAQARPFTAEDMLAIVRISGAVAVSPAGDRLAFVLPDLSDEWNVGERRQLGSVHVLSLIAGTTSPEIVGRPGQRSSFPVFSPDGRRLALYLEGPAGGHLAVWDIERRVMSVVSAHFPGGAWMAPAWAGDSRIVFQRPAAPEAESPPPRVRVLESSDAVLPGDAVFRSRRSSGLAMVNLSTGEERSLVADGRPLQRFEVSPDGRHAIVDIGADGDRSLLFSLDRVEAEPRTSRSGQRLGWLADGRLYWREQGRLLAAREHDFGTAAVTLLDPLEPAFTSLVWSPDAVRFASLVADPTITDPEIERPQTGMYTIARPFTDVYVVSTPGGTASNLTSHIPDRIGEAVWGDGGRSLFFVATDNASYDETLYRYDVMTSAVTALAEGRESYGSLIPVPGGVVASIQSATTPPDLWRIDALTGQRTRVTELNPQLSEFAFSQPEIFYFDSQHGDRLGALLFKPVGLVTDVPVVTYVYEKLTPGINGFQARHQILATHGYAVLMPNVRVRVGETATSFVESVVPAIAAVHAMGFTNGRACLWGGSFGAYATSFVITQTNVFDCAVSRATPPELFRNWASGRDRDSDNIESGQARMGGSPFEVMDRYLSQSAFFHLDRVETPVLITHGLRDYTILHEEGAMMFYALRRLGKAATFVSYREGDHSLYRHSRQDALDVHRRMLDWFEKYLRR